MYFLPMGFWKIVIQPIYDREIFLKYFDDSFEFFHDFIGFENFLESIIYKVFLLF